MLFDDIAGLLSHRVFGTVFAVVVTLEGGVHPSEPLVVVLNARLSEATVRRDRFIEVLQPAEPLLELAFLWVGAHSREALVDRLL